MAAVITRQRHLQLLPQRGVRWTHEGSSMVTPMKMKRCNSQEAAWTLETAALLIQSRLHLRNENVHRCKKVEWNVITGQRRGAWLRRCAHAGMNRKKWRESNLINERVLFERVEIAKWHYVITQKNTESKKVWSERFRGKGETFTGIAQMCHVRGENNVPVFGKFGPRRPICTLFRKVFLFFNLKIIICNILQRPFFFSVILSHPFQTRVTDDFVRTWQKKSFGAPKLFAKFNYIFFTVFKLAHFLPFWNFRMLIFLCSLLVRTKPKLIPETELEAIFSNWWSRIHEGAFQPLQRFGNP